MTNSADPDQLASEETKKPTDLDLHCLLRQGMSCLAREGLSYFLSLQDKGHLCFCEWAVIAKLKPRSYLHINLEGANWNNFRRWPLRKG